jgi:GGDEF domain-containing protein
MIMDVNKLQGVHADGEQPHRQPYDRHHDTPDDAADGEVGQEAYRLRSSDVVVDLGGVPSDLLSVESEKIVNAFVEQIEPLRAELEILRKREEHFRDQAAQHAFLPLPNRREFRRELNYVIDHMYNLQPSPAVLMLHVVTAAPFRREYGRRAADALLIHVAEHLSCAVHPTDAIGSVGDDDFGVILLIGGAETASRRAGEIGRYLNGHTFAWLGTDYPLKVIVGWADLRANWNADQAIEAADRSLRDQLRRLCQAPDGFAGGC